MENPNIPKLDDQTLLAIELILEGGVQKMHREIEIIEMPIYLLSDEEYQNKVNNRINIRADQLMEFGHSKERALECAHIELPWIPWRYNQIVGYLIISVSKCDMYFNLFYPMENRISYNRSKKVKIENQNLGGYHFRIQPTMSNAHIIAEMIEHLESIKNDQIRNNHYLDEHVFYNIVDQLDIRKVIDCIQD